MYEEMNYVQRLSHDPTPRPEGVAVDTSTSQAYLGNKFYNTVAVLNTTNTVRTTLTVGSPTHALAMNSSRHRAYIANANDNTVSVINTLTNQVTDTVSVGGKPEMLGWRVHVLTSIRRRFQSHHARPLVMTRNCRWVTPGDSSTRVRSNCIGAT